MDGNRCDPLAVFTGGGNVVRQSRRPKGSDSFDALLLLDPTPLAPNKTEHTESAGVLRQVLNDPGRIKSCRGCRQASSARGSGHTSLTSRRHTTNPPINRPINPDFGGSNRVRGGSGQGPKHPVPRVICPAQSTFLCHRGRKRESPGQTGRDIP